MSSPASTGIDVVASAAACAALSVDFLLHPVDTLITRIQSPTYTTQYRTISGSVHRSLFLGLYQGFGPTIISGIPSSAAFFAIYEGLGSYFRRAKSSGHFASIPLPVLHGASGAIASVVSCAIANPAEVLKQNAQVYRRDTRSLGTVSPTLQTLKHFAKQPKRLWAGYTTLVASYLPSTTLMFCLYEALMEQVMGKHSQPNCNTPAQQVLASGLCGGVAGGASSGFFVPIDVVKTRMRLAAGGDIAGEYHAVQETTVGESKRAKPRVNTGPFAVAREVVLKEGVRGLFRGTGLTFVASTVGSGLYLACYEACKIYLS